MDKNPSKGIFEESVVILFNISSCFWHLSSLTNISLFRANLVSCDLIQWERLDLCFPWYSEGKTVPYLAKLDKILYPDRKDLCFYCALCVELETDRCLATPEARKFWVKEKNYLSYAGNFEAKRIFACHVCWSTKQTEKYNLFI